jgi:hypothetical protein
MILKANEIPIVIFVTKLELENKIVIQIETHRDLLRLIECLLYMQLLLRIIVGGFNIINWFTFQ